MAHADFAQLRDGQKKRLDNFFSWCSALVMIVILFSPLLRSDFIFDTVSLSLLLIGCFGISMLWVSMADAPYSLKQVHWVFYVTFFAVAPLMQYVNGVWPWGYTPSQSHVMHVCVLVLAWGIVFAAASGRTKFASQVRDSENSKWLNEKMTFFLPPLAKTLLPLGCVACLGVLVAVTGIDNMFLRTETHVDIGSSSISLVISVCLRAFVFGSFALLSLNARREKSGYGGVAIAGACLVLTCFPTALARFNIAAIYLGIAILLLPSFSRKRGLFSFVLIMGFLVAYPMFDAFKYIEGTDSLTEVIGVIANSMASGYSTGNYDAFSVMFWCFDYVKMFDFSYGGQLLGACLFFIPRALWETKPVPSGELVFESLNYHFTDISFPLPFEGYLNFGFIGLLLFALVYGLIVRKLDWNYWKSRFRHTEATPSILMLYYPFLLCLTFYMLRGAMMTTFTYVIGDLAVMTLLHYLVSILMRKNAVKQDSAASVSLSNNLRLPI